MNNDQDSIDGKKACIECKAEVVETSTSTEGADIRLVSALRNGHWPFCIWINREKVKGVFKQ